jgi:Rrf2 family nitric oxide-sensitive transcriptional repressor
MRLTKWTDYTLRVLMHCAATRHRETPVTIQEIAQRHDISRSHLMKIVMTLSSQGWIESIRGRGGGIRLLVPAEQLIIGDVLRKTETDFNLVECFDREENTCRLDGRCHLKTVLEQAMASYMQVLDNVSLADLLPKPDRPAETKNIFFT